MTTQEIRSKSCCITLTTHADGKRDLRFYDANGKSLLAGANSRDTVTVQGSFVDGVAALMAELEDARIVIEALREGDSGLMDALREYVATYRR